MAAASTAAAVKIAPALERQEQLLEALRALSGERSLDFLLARVMEQATQVAGADRSSLFLYDRERDELWSKIAQGLDTTEIRFPAGMGLAGHVARTGEVLNIPDAYADARFNPAWDQQTGYRTRSVLTLPLVSRCGEPIGVLQVLNKRDGGPFTSADESCLGALASHAAVFIENVALYERIEALFEAMVRVTIHAIDERDPATSGHSARVTTFTQRLARLVHEDEGPRFGRVRFTREGLRELRYAALLHDCGKIGVRESVLGKANKLAEAELQLVCARLERRALELDLAAAERRAAGREADEAALAAEKELLRRRGEVVQRANLPVFLEEADACELEAMLREGLLTRREFDQLAIRQGNLTPDEWEDMRSHVRRSYHLLSQIPWPDELADVPYVSYSHHERLDGSGYPRGLGDADIPLGAKLLAVADTYDALTAADRPYKKAMSHERACEILRREAREGRLDPGLVDLFIEGRAWESEAEPAAVTAEAV